MALTNIELYEALKRDLSEDSARMIAEVVPPAGDLTTKPDFQGLRAEFADVRAEFAGLRAEFADVRAEFAGLRRYVEERLAKTDRRIGAYGLALLVPVWGATIAAVFKLVLEL